MCFYEAFTVLSQFGKHLGETPESFTKQAIKQLIEYFVYLMITDNKEELEALKRAMSNLFDKVDGYEFKGKDTFEEWKKQFKKQDFEDQFTEEQPAFFKKMYEGLIKDWKKK